MKRLIAVIIVSTIAVTCSACSGFGIKVEGYRIDEIQHSQATQSRPFKCLFVECVAENNNLK